MLKALPSCYINFFFSSTYIGLPFTKKMYTHLIDYNVILSIAKLNIIFFKYLLNNNFYTI